MDHPGKKELHHLNETVKDLFQAISFEKGAQPNIAEIKKLFVEGGLMVNCNEEQPQVFQVDQFITHFEALFNEGNIASLHEVEVHHKTKIYDTIAHRYSFYEAHEGPDLQPFAVGINTIQFIKIDSKWKITSMAWNNDDRGDGFFDRTMKCVQRAT